MRPALTFNDRHAPDKTRTCDAPLNRPGGPGPRSPDDPQTHGESAHSSLPDPPKGGDSPRLHGALTGALTEPKRDPKSAGKSTSAGYLLALSGGPVAQLVEHVTENHGVESSILSWATSFCPRMAR